MNEETKTPEPLAAILAEMRDERIIRLDDAVVTRCLLRNLADRIEAAAERERIELHDLVRRLVEYADAVTCYRHLTVEVVSSEHPAWTFDGAALLREARAALGEGETPTGKGVGE